MLTPITVEVEVTDGGVTVVDGVLVVVIRVDITTVNELDFVGTGFTSLSPSFVMHVSVTVDRDVCARVKGMMEERIRDLRNKAPS